MSAFAPERDGVWIERLASALGRSLGGTAPALRGGALLPQPARASLAQYVALVASWNEKLNLTGARTPEALVEVLLCDAFVLSDPELLPQAARVLDVGSGAGAPIVPLLLLRPDLSALCVEPLRKRATFLRTVSARLGLLPRMRVLEERLDLEQPQVFDSGTAPALGDGAAFRAFDIACSRATFAPEVWLPLALRLSPRGLVLTASAAPPLAPEGAVRLALREYALPFSGARRHAAVYERTAE